MSVATLITKLHDLGVRVRLDGGELKIKAPKGVLTKELQLELKASKADIIEFLSAAQSGDSSASAVIKPAPDGVVLLPSYSQQRLWFLDQLDPGNSVYNIPFVLRLGGALNTEAMQAAFNDLVARHDALRTRFVTDASGEPIIDIAASLTLPVDVIDMAGASNTDISTKLEELNADTFNLATGPLIRMQLLKIADDDHVLLILMHHIISDAWSLNVISQELAACYEARCRSEQATLPELPLRFADFAWWQRETLTEAELERQTNYWRDKLAGAPEVLELPTDFTRPAMPSNRGGRVQANFSREITDALNALAKDQNATLFMVLMAAADLLLSRYSGQDDIVVGTPIAGRDRTELEGLIGFFINNLVMRTDLSGNPSFKELVGRARDTALDAYSHQSLPFEKLVEELQPERSQSLTPIYQVQFMLQNAPMEGGGFAGLEASGLGFDYGTAKFDLTIATIETADGIATEFEYNKDIFEHSTIERMVAHFGRLLEGIAADPGKAIGDYDLLSDTERRQLLVEWNDTAFDYPLDGTMHGLFEKQAAATPDATAIYHNGREISYGELNQRANRLAHHLLAKGVQPESLIAVNTERSIEMLTGMMAILKAGCAYVPVDPDYPAERVAYMLEDSQAPVVLTSSSVLPKLPASDADVVVLDEFDFDNDSLSSENPGLTVPPARLGYTIYTSGSTGLPKGVEIEHGNAVALIEWMGQVFDPAEFKGVLASTSICFDLSVYEIFGTLGLGGRIVLVADALALPSLPDTANVTLINTVPSAIAELVRMNGLPESLKTVNLAGEPLSTPLVNDIYATGSVERVNDLYGPSEDTTYSTWTRRLANAKATIGKPIYNTQAYVLDKNQRLAPPGVPGELYLGGRGVTRGYRNQPELTAEKYLPDSFKGEGRLYRTGDLVRFRPDGNLEYIGRIDHQIKLRGFRIELGEIEATLIKHPAVDKAVVIIREDQPGDKRLVAYVVTSQQPEASELSSFVQATLPSYMVPAAFILLDELPLTPNGKLDRKALPKPEWSSEESYQAPRNETEETLCGIWEAVLGAENIGINDDFFELGGHSLLATRLFSRIRESFDADLPLRTLFDTPTVAGLAEAITQQDGSGSQTAITAIDRSDDLPISFAQQRMWLLNQLEPESSVYNVSLVRRLRQEPDRAAMQTAMNELVRRHESLRSIFLTEHSEPKLVILSELEVPVRWNETSDLQSTLSELGNKPFNLSQGPLIRLDMIKDTDGSFVMLLNLHHIISDAWSFDVLMSELVENYQAVLDGKTLPVQPPLALQYVDYAAWQRTALEQDSNPQLEYWRKELDDALELLELPTDYSRPASQSYAGGLVHQLIDPESAEQVRRFAAANGNTVFMVLMAAFHALMARYSGQNDISVGTPVSGRNRSELEPMIGFFLNTLVIRSDLSDTPTFKQLVERTKRKVLDAQAHQDLPFEKLVEELKPTRDTSYSPLFQVMFTLQTVANNESDTPLASDPVEFDYASAKYDLTLSVGDSGEGALGLSLEYSSDLFNGDTAARILAHYKELLGNALKQPEIPVDRIDMLLPHERDLLLNEWNDTAFDYPASSTMHGLFEHQAAAKPDAVAIYHEGNEISYAELNARANRLAHHLIAQGVKPESLIAVNTERSIEMLTGMMAILKAGCAYVPVDPDYPPERVAYMLEDSQAPLILTSAAVKPSLPEISAKIIVLDEFDFSDQQLSAENPGLPVSPAQLAYTIYTSGSTGLPKGVEIEHGNAVALIEWTRDSFDPAEFEGVLASTSICFDLSVYEIFCTLGLGGRIVLVANALGISSLPADANVTLINTVPSAIAELVRLDWLPASLKTVNLAGEPLSTALVNDIYATGTVERVNDLYGPSEDTTYSTWTRRKAQAKATIGRPIYNTQAYVLDTHQQPTPIGVPGELYLGGAGVTRGYRNQPELTAEKYLPDHFSGEGRLYRTGDLVRYRADGNLEYIGRIDHQIKLRGFRIELGEIEASLINHPAIEKAVVIIREDQPGDKRLVAYVVTDQQLSSAEMSQHLRNNLPAYMVPGAFVLLAELPLTPNGKLDRKALPVPEQDSAQETVAPRNDLEQQLADIWCDVLGINNVGINDNFFDLGGHSLLATRLLAEIGEALGSKLALKIIFEAPTIEQQAHLLSDGAPVDSRPPLLAADRSMPLPASFGQERLWFLEQMSPGSNNYNIPWAVRINGTLDTTALQQAVDQLCARHEALRTTFSEGDSSPLQIIHPSLTVPVTLHTMHGANDEQLSDKVNELLVSGFDLAQGPLLRIDCIEVSSDNFVLLFNMHHIVSDGWSVGIVNRELQALYAGIISQQTVALKKPGLHFADYAVWQRSWLSNEELDTQVGYWREQLDGAPTLLDLPTDRPRPPVQTFSGASVSWSLDDGTAAELSALAKESGTTMYMVLLAAFKVLLYRYTSQDDIVVGSPVSGREHAGLSDMVGFFVNTLALRSSLTDEKQFDALLGEVRNTVLDAFAHQDIPFEKLVEELKPERSRAHTPIFQVAFILQNLPGADNEFAGLDASNFSFSSASSKFDMSFSMWDSPDAIGGDLEYNTDLFDQSTAERLIAHYKTLLQSIAKAPAQPVGRLQMLDTDELQLVTETWNQTAADYPQDSSIAAVFETQAAATPDAPALRCADVQLSYDELNRKANQLAHLLKDYGVGPDTMVSLCLDRGIDALIAILGILKAGGAYVPLDPGYPAERLEFMLQDTSTPVLLSDSNIELNINTGNCQRINLNEIAAELNEKPDANLPATANGRNLAYVIYTSGSTGLPKGTLIEQRSVLRLVLNNPYTLFGPGIRIGMLAPISFDASTYEMWGSLLNGGECVIFPDRVPTIDTFGAFLETSDITSAWITASLFNTIVDSNVNVLRNLKHILTGGEAISVDHARRAYKALPDVTLINGYGPTESTTFTTTYEMPAPVPDDLASMPIGRPIANTQCYILDRQMQPAGVGIPGELYIGGDGLARGYLNRPDLTAERFVDNPFGPERLYKTGDQVRWTTAGIIEFIGRIDNQVKLRGFRIELGEIEAALREHPQVANTAVIVQEISSTDKRLVAYVVVDGAIEKLSHTMRDFLNQSLPGYMIPSAFIALDEIPLTANGKLDHRALPTIQESSANDTPAALPGNATEEALLQIWKDLLQVNNIGIHDDFFELGGHSLLTIRLIKAITEETGQQLQISDVFEHPTIAGLANIISGEVQAAPHTPKALIPLNTGGDGLPEFLIGMSELGLDSYLGRDRPVYALDMKYFRGYLGTDSVVELAAIYVADMLSIQPDGPYSLTGYSANAAILLEMIAQLKASGAAVRQICLINPPAMHQSHASEITWDTVYSGAVGRLKRALCSLYAARGGRAPGYLRSAWNLVIQDQWLSETNGAKLDELLAETDVLLIPATGEESQLSGWESLQTATMASVTVDKREAGQTTIISNLDILAATLEAAWKSKD